LPLTVYLLALCQALMFISASMLITVSALIGLELASNKALATLPLALQFIAIMLTSVPASLAMGKWGRKRCFTFAGLIGVAGAALALLAIYQQSFWLFCIATPCFGAFSAFGNYYRFTAAEVVSEENKSVAISWVMAGGVLAAFVGPNLVIWSQNLLEVSRYAGAFVITGCVFTLSIFTVSFMQLPAPQQADDTNQPQRKLLHIASQPIFLVAVSCAAFGYATMNLIMTATPLAMKHHSMQLHDTAFVIQWHVLAMFAPSFITGNIIKRVGVLKVLLTGVVFCLACVVINLAGTGLWHFWLALLLLGIGWNFLFVGGTTLVTESYQPHERARTQAMNDFIIFSTVSLTALSSGTLHHWFGWRIVNLSVLPFLLLAAAGVLILAKIRASGPLGK